MDMKEFSEVLSNVVISFGVLAGGGWALWKWCVQELIRQRQRRNSVESFLETESIRHSDDGVILTVTSVWENQSVFPLSIDTKRSYVQVWKVPSNLEPQALQVKNLSKMSLKSIPYGDRKTYTLQPGVKNRLVAHFILEPESAYAIRWKLYKDPQKHKKSTYAWTKEKFVSTKLNSSLGSPVKG